MLIRERQACAKAPFPEPNCPAKSVVQLSDGGWILYEFNFLWIASGSPRAWSGACRKDDERAGCARSQAV